MLQKRHGSGIGKAIKICTRKQADMMAPFNICNKNEFLLSYFQKRVEKFQRFIEFAKAWTKIEFIPNISPCRLQRFFPMLVIAGKHYGEVPHLAICLHLRQG
jgi:hypothetical protein